MKLTVAIPAPGAMGAAVGARLVSRGATVLTSLTGRSAASAQRADQAGMSAADDEALARADLLLSIVPPDQAVHVMERLAPVLSAAVRKPLVIDCNAVNPDTVSRVAEVVADTGCGFVDAGIISLPPKPETPGPMFFVSGPQAGRAFELEHYGLRLTRLDGPIGAASALKMSYGAITKGLVALGASMALAADRHGVGQALRNELAASQPHLLAIFQRMIPDMFGKAYRWVPEMEQIAGFLGERAERQIFEGAAGLYARLADDLQGTRSEVDNLAALFGKP